MRRINFDKYSISEIKAMIADGKVTREEVDKFYGWKHWDDGLEVYPSHKEDGDESVCANDQP